MLWYRYTCTSSWGTISMQLVWSKSRKVSHEILFLASGPSTLPRKECEQSYLTSYEYQRVTGNVSIKRLQWTLLCNFHNATGKKNSAGKKKELFALHVFSLVLFSSDKGFQHPHLTGSGSFTFASIHSELPIINFHIVPFQSCCRLQVRSKQWMCGTNCPMRLGLRKSWTLSGPPTQGIKHL